MKISNLPQKDLIHQVDMGVNAVLRIAEVETALREQGMSPEKAQKGLDMLKDVMMWQGRQDLSQRHVQKSQRTLRQLRDSIDSIYSNHRACARFVYRNDEDMMKHLHLHGAKKQKYTHWLEQVQKFYGHLDVKALEVYGVLPKEVSEVRKLISQLSELHVLRNDARRQAQQVTEAKKKAVNNLRKWYRHFVSVAELACYENPQMMEALGIVVSSK